MPQKPRKPKGKARKAAITRRRTIESDAARELLDRLIKNWMLRRKTKEGARWTAKQVELASDEAVRLSKISRKIHLSHISKMTKKKGAVPGLDILIRYATSFGLTPEEFVSEREILKDVESKHRCVLEEFRHFLTVADETALDEVRKQVRHSLSDLALRSPPDSKAG